jgi:hypothetical protein
VQDGVDRLWLFVIAPIASELGVIVHFGSPGICGERAQLALGNVDGDERTFADADDEAATHGDEQLAKLARCDAQDGKGRLLTHE